MDSAVGQLPPEVAERVLLASRRRRGVAARALRYSLLGRICRNRGELVDVREDVYLLNAGGLDLGSRISIHPLCYIDGYGGIRIGDDVSIAHAVTIMSSEHSLNDSNVPIRDQPLRAAPTSIGSNVWIGAGSRILAGATIGDHVVIGAGSVVKGVVPSGVVVAGVPARHIRDLAGESPRGGGEGSRGT